MRRCELCKSVATVYCDSDRARLCWSCDAEVHSANFLVARHLRNLLCRICQSPTPWSATGEKLCPSTASVCGRCDVEDDRNERFGGNNGEIGTESDDEHEVDENSVDEVELEDSVNEYDNQVVPWSSTPTPPPPPAVSSSSGEEVFIGDGGVLLKRKRQNVTDLTSEELDCSSANVNHHTPAELASEDEMTSCNSTLSNSTETGRKIKRIRHRNVISGDYTSVLDRGTTKSTRIAQFDLNSPPFE